MSWHLHLFGQRQTNIMVSPSQGNVCRGLSDGISVLLILAFRPLAYYLYY